MKLGWKRVLTICAALGLAGLLVAMAGKALGGRTAVAFRTDEGMMIYRPWGSAFYSADGGAHRGVVDNMIRLARWGDAIDDLDDLDDLVRWGENMEAWGEAMSDWGAYIGDWGDSIGDLGDWIDQEMDDFEESFENWEDSVDWDALGVEFNQWFEEGEVTMGPVTNEKLGDVRELDTTAISAPVRVKEGEGFSISIIQNNDRLEVGYQMKDGRLTVKERKIPGLPNVGNVKANEIEITMPAGVSLGAVQLRSVSGNIDLDLEDAVAETVRIDTVSGNVKADGLTASQAELQSVSGRLELDADVSQQTTMYSVSGRIQADGRLTGEIRAETVSGGVELKLEGQPDQYQWNCASMSGSILADGQSSKRSASKSGGPNRINVDTVSGRIQLEFDKD